jgi:MFS family permease
LSRLDSTALLPSLLSWDVAPLLVVTAVLLPLFWLREHRAEDPVVRPRLLAPRQVRLVAAFAAGAGVSEAAMVFLPSLAVASLGVGEATASFMLVPLVLALAVGSPVAGRLLDAVGSKPVVIAGLALTAAGLVIFGLASGQLTGFLLGSVATGLGLSSLLGAPLRYILLDEADERDRGASQGLLTVFTSVGQLVGAALVGAVAATSAGGFAHALLVLGVIVALLVVPALTLRGRRSGPRRLRQNRTRPARRGTLRGPLGGPDRPCTPSFWIFTTYSAGPSRSSASPPSSWRGRARHRGRRGTRRRTGSAGPSPS